MTCPPYIQIFDVVASYPILSHESLRKCSKQQNNCNLAWWDDSNSPSGFKLLWRYIWREFIPFALKFW